MCRLYGLRATHPTKAACELLDAQNALIRQSQEDARGLSNPDGWGMGHVVDGTTGCFRQVEPASESADYREAALTTKGTTLLAHVRRATIGSPQHDNTHPFRHGAALLIHNGHVPAFEQVKPVLLNRLDSSRRGSVQGTTDSEHVLALLLQLRDERPDALLHAVTRTAIRLLQSWVHDAASEVQVQPVDAEISALPHDEVTAILGLNLLWTDGTTLAGSRLNRTLWRLRRETVPTCPICGSKHAAPPDPATYRAAVFASERITDEPWTEVPNGSVFATDADGSVEIEPIGDT